MSRDVLTFLFFTFFFGIAYGQSPRELIRTERTRVLRLVEAKQFDAIDLSNVYIKGIESLTKIEQEMILLFQRKFEILPSRIKEHEAYVHKDGLFRVQSNLSVEHPNLSEVSAVINDTLSRTLVQKFLSEKDVLLYELDQSELSQEPKVFLRYYIHFLDYQFDICDYNKQQKAIKSAKELADEFPTSTHLAFPRNYNNREWKQLLDFVIHAGFGRSNLTDGLSEHLRPRFNSVMTFELRWNNFEVSTHMSFLTQEVTQDFEGVYTPFYKGRGTRFTSMGLGLGYSIPLTQSIEFTPFFGYKDTGFNGLFFDDMDRDTVNFRRVKGSNFFTGANLDWYFFKDNCEKRKEQQRYFGNFSSNIGLRFQFGVLNPNLQNSLEPLTGNVYYYGLGIVMKYFSFTGKRTRF
ncbi:MAG: hypothetical protein JJT77_09320 [Crocinitomicaceae bacterium]|nr:hypothetical protein [Crocinitomicaceae bacterium]